MFSAAITYLTFKVCLLYSKNLLHFLTCYMFFFSLIQCFNYLRRAKDQKVCLASLTTHKWSSSGRQVLCWLSGAACVMECLFACASGDIYLKEAWQQHSWHREKLASAGTFNPVGHSVGEGGRAVTTTGVLLQQLIKRYNSWRECQYQFKFLMLYLK